MDWLIGFMPILLFVLVCPLMMIFMMRGMHGGHGQPSGREDPRENPSAGERIAELEQQVRELRDERDRKREKAA